MDIQFQCPACSQPIEIGPEWGGKAVVCPYCNKTVTAPQESTYQPAPEAPVARPSPAPTGFEVVDEVPAMPQYARPGGRNPIALWALMLSCASLVCVVIAKVIFAPHTSEMQRLVSEGKTPMEVQQFILEQHGGTLPDWLLHGSLLVFLALLLWLAGLVCALLGVRQEPRRRLAVMSLITLGAVPILTCCIG